MVRVELHLTEDEANKLDIIARQHNRSRKNYAETAIRSLIDSFDVIASIKVKKKSNQKLKLKKS